MSASPASATGAANLPDEILTLLRCPVTGGTLSNGVGVLISNENPQLRYPVSQGVPQLLADAAV